MKEDEEGKEGHQMSVEGEKDSTRNKGRKAKTACLMREDEEGRVVRTLQTGSP